MRILVFSDSHGHTTRLRAAAKSVQADAIIHLGDHAKDAEILQDIAPLYVVQGNCDFTSAPIEQVIELGGKRLFITHGHRYYVKSELDTLYRAADKAGAHVALYGHTHLPGYEYRGRMLLLNPGAIIGSRDSHKSTFAVLEWQPGGEIYMQMTEI